MLKAYFDTGNFWDSRACDIVTVAGYSGHARYWRAIEEEWAWMIAAEWADCRMPDELPYLHTRDAVGLSGLYSKDNGWSQSRVDRLLTSCTKLISKAVERKELNGLSCSVLLKDYKKVIQEDPDRPHIIDTCAAWCVATALLFESEEFIKDGASLFFDRGEKVAGSILNRWNNEAQRQKFPLWERIWQVSQRPMHDSPGIQMADLLAWSVNDYYVQIVRETGGERNKFILSGVSRGVWHDALLSQPRRELWLDEKQLRNPNHEEMKRFKNLRLPRRRPVP